MTAFIALLRGVNVGGHNKLPMKALSAIVAAEGGKDVSTYIQSGNVVFRASKSDASVFENSLSGAIEAEFGFKPDVLVLDQQKFKTALKNNPFAAACEDPSKLLVMFLKMRADKAALKEVEALLANGEEVAATGSALYFHAPAGIARSRAGDKLARLFSGGTMRNWRTCLKLQEMLGALA